MNESSIISKVSYKKLLELHKEMCYISHKETKGVKYAY